MLTCTSKYMAIVSGHLRTSLKCSDYQGVLIFACKWVLWDHYSTCKWFSVLVWFCKYLYKLWTVQRTGSIVEPKLYISTTRLSASYWRVVINNSSILIMEVCLFSSALISRFTILHCTWPMCRDCPH